MRGRLGVAAAVVGGLAVAALAFPFYLDYRSQQEARRATARTPIHWRAATAPAASTEMVRFTEVAAASGISYVQFRTDVPADRYGPVDWHSGGASTVDYDNDGWMDLFVTRGDDAGILYRNLGPDSQSGLVMFRDVTAAAGLDHAVHCNGPVWADLDNDGDADLFTSTHGFPRYYLFVNNGNGTFSEEGVARGADCTNEVLRYGLSASAGDYDNDGYLDLCVAEWLQYSPTCNEKSGLRLLRNLGKQKPAHFEDVTVQAGIRMPMHAGVTLPQLKTESGEPRPVSMTPRFSDLDGDGLVDLPITSDYETTRLYWNKGDGTFADGTEAGGVKLGMNDMGSTIADFDGDGRLDWFITDITWKGVQARDGNHLYLNNGDRTFTDLAGSAGVKKGGWGWGASFLDYDNDSDLDLVSTNGFPMGPGAAETQMGARGGFRDDRAMLWRNNAEGGAATTFSDVSDQVGMRDVGQGKSLVVFDYDNDGDQDVFIANHGMDRPTLYRNDGGNKLPWLRIRTIGSVCNRDGAGALITVTDPRLKWPLVWEVSRSSNYLGQNEPTAHFGLGEAVTDTVQLVNIRWPSGRRQEFRDVPVRTTLVARESESSPTTATAAGGS
jgi:hypothetical protein